jgi:NADH-quinone oxidoreductase subunit C
MGGQGRGMDREELEKVVINLEPNAHSRGKADRAAVVVPVENLLNLMSQLIQNDQFSFDMLLDHTAIDHIGEGKFELVYNIYSTEHAHYLMVSCLINRDKPIVPTVSGLWPAAHWQEREVFDLFGVLYDGHTDLRRIFLDDDWEGYPLRKDYSDPGMLEFEK